MADIVSLESWRAPSVDSLVVESFDSESDEQLDEMIGNGESIERGVGGITRLRRVQRGSRLEVIPTGAAAHSSVLPGGTLTKNERNRRSEERIVAAAYKRGDISCDDILSSGWKKIVSKARTAVRVSKPAPPLPGGLYRVVYADPPWRYEYSISDSRRIENQYPTMELEEICDLAVPSAPDSVLYLWATTAKLSEAMQVVEAWGFTYRTSMVWVKESIGMGYYARGRHEFLLIATRGKPGTPAPANRPDSVIEAPRLKHSAKPLEVYTMIEQAWPRTARVELFARNQREGWTSWGNEI